MSEHYPKYHLSAPSKTIDMRVYGKIFIAACGVDSPVFAFSDKKYVTCQRCMETKQFKEAPSE